MPNSMARRPALVLVHPDWPRPASRVESRRLGRTGLCLRGCQVFLEPPVPLCLPLSRLSNANDAKDQKKRNKESWNQAQRQRRHGAQFRNPTLPDHDFQSPRQGGAVQGKEFSQFALSQVSGTGEQDRKSTRLNSSHTVISYAVFCLKKKTNKEIKHT